MGQSMCVVLSDLLLISGELSFDAVLVHLEMKFWCNLIWQLLGLIWVFVLVGCYGFFHHPKSETTSSSYVEFSWELAAACFSLTFL